MATEKQLPKTDNLWWSVRKLPKTLWLSAILLLAFFVFKWGLASFFYQAADSAYLHQNIGSAEKMADWSLFFSRQAKGERLLAKLKLEAIKELLAGPVDLKILPTQFRDLYTQSLNLALTATKLDRQDAANWQTLGLVYESALPFHILGAYEQAKSAYQTALLLKPFNADNLVALARIELAVGQETSARDYLNQALVIKPDHLLALLSLAQIDYNDGQLDLAVMRAKRATLAQSDNFQAWFLLGFFQYQQANYLLAESSLNQALKINPASADAQYFLGLTFDQQGHRPEALALFKHLVTANPANLDLQKIVANLEAGRPAFASSSPSLSKSKKIKALNL